MKKWIISITSMLLIWGAGAFAFFYIKEEVPKSLKAASTIVGKEEPAEEVVSQDLKEIIHNAQKLVVKVEMPDGSFGSGFLYNNRGDIVTNAHVVANSQNVTVKTSDSKELPGVVIGVSSVTDVAVVRVVGLEGTTPLKVANRDGEVGDEVLALGTPLGLENTVTTGIISGIDRDFDIEPFHYEDAYQISAPIAPGNSGGPLIDSKTGEVLGINSAGIEQGGIGFSIPIVSVLSLIEGWSESPMTSLPNVAFETEGYSYEEEEYSIEDYSSYLVSYFYESLNYGDYVTAYSLLGSSWQSSTSYEDFRNGYLNTSSVNVEDLSVSSKGEKATVVAIVSAEERKDGTDVLSKYKVTYEIGYENDQLKIISGKGEEL